MEINKKTFCVAPWFQIRNSNNMSKKVCCQIKPFAEDENSKNLTPLEYLNSDHIINLKKQLTQGKKPDACSTCWQDELNGLPSLRKNVNGVITGGNFAHAKWIDSYFKRKNNYNSDMILMADVKIGNTCNHSCVMCNPEDSSLIYNDWIKRKESEFVKDYLRIDANYFDTVKFNGYKNKKYRDYINDVLQNNKNLKYLKILGGEPFLDNKLLSVLKNMDKKIKKKLKLHFTTNGSIDIKTVLDYIGKFDYIKIIVSVEGIGQVHEYARAGSNWNLLEKNILTTKERNICDISIHHSLQTATVLGFRSLLEWCKKYQVKLNCGLVKNPKYLSISALPSVLKKQIFENIDPFEKHFVTETDIENKVLPYERLIEKIKDVSYDPLLNEQFFKYINWYEHNKNIPKLQSIFPQLYKKYND